MYGLKPEFQNDMYNNPKNCSDFSSDADAKNYFDKLALTNLFKWWDKANKIRGIETGINANSFNDEWLRNTVLMINEIFTHQQIQKFIIQKFNSARNLYCL